MTFAEYLWAVDMNRAAEIVLGTPTDPGEAVHNHLLEELRKYFVVGGMPESVLALTASGSLLECGEVHREIVEAYRADFSKYYPNCPQALVFSTGPFTPISSKGIHRLPLYFAFASARGSQQSLP